MEELLSLALERPEEARARAEGVLRTASEPGERAYALQCLGLVERNAGRTTTALRHLRSAMR